MSLYVLLGILGSLLIANLYVSNSLSDKLSSTDLHPITKNQSANPLHDADEILENINYLYKSSLPTVDTKITEIEKLEDQLKKEFMMIVEGFNVFINNQDNHASNVNKTMGSVKKEFRESFEDQGQVKEYKREQTPPSFSPKESSPSKTSLTERE